MINDDKCDDILSSFTIIYSLEFIIIYLIVHYIKQTYIMQTY